MLLVQPPSRAGGEPALSPWRVNYLRESAQYIIRNLAKKGYKASTIAVLPDHLHLSLRGAIDQAPEAIALSFLNNLAYALGQPRCGRRATTRELSANMVWVRYAGKRQSGSAGERAGRLALPMLVSASHRTTFPGPPGPEKATGIGECITDAFLRCRRSSQRTPSPAGQAGRGRPKNYGAWATLLASELLHLPDKPAGVGRWALCSRV